MGVFRHDPEAWGQERTGKDFWPHSGTTLVLCSRSISLPSPRMARCCSQPLRTAVSMAGKPRVGICCGGWVATQVRLFSLHGEAEAHVLAFCRAYHSDLQCLNWASTQDRLGKAGAGGQGDGTWSLGHGPLALADLGSDSTF